MYLNDHSRSEFYESIGLDTTKFNMHVIHQTNKTTASIFPQVIDTYDPKFKMHLDELVGVNQKLAKAESPMEKAPLIASFAFHLLSIVWWGPAVLAVAALWTWRMSWRSSEEFRVLHEDYQRQRKGLSTVYADHFEALTDTQRSLTTILALPIFGFMLIVMGIPAQVPDNNMNGATLLAYLIVVAFGVVYLLRRSNKTYGRIYGRLTDIETASARIERDLADPARLLGDLAEDGLGLADLLDEASQAARELSDSAEWDDQEVADDA